MGAPLDLHRLAERVRAQVGSPRGYLVGRTKVRNAIHELLECSFPKAERLVATLESHGLLTYQGDPQRGVDRGVVAWHLGRQTQ